MGPIGGAAIAKALTDLATKKAEARKQGNKDVPDLESIVCGRNRLENGSMAAWAEMYAAHAQGIKSVKMTQNGIRQEGISHLLTKGLGECKGLEVLDMQDNTFTFMGATALAGVIGKWTELRELGVGDDLLGGRGAVKLFETFAEGKNQRVEVLRLQYNDIDARGVKALLHAAKTALPALRRVELNGNKFSEEDPSIESLSELLSERKEEKGKDHDPDEHWGIDELDELESEDEEDEGDEAEVEEQEEEEEKVDYGERVLKEADEAEGEKVTQKKDGEVDELAEKLGKTEL